MIRSIIIEDKKMYSRYLSDLIKDEFPDIHIMAICETVADGIAQVKSLKPELIFLDVELPPNTGFDLLEETREQDYKVIFTTSFNQYAIKAIKFSALDYLLKPIDRNDLKEAIEKYKHTESLQQNIHTLLDNLKLLNDKKTYEQKIAIPVGNSYMFTEISQITRCLADVNYTKIYFLNNSDIRIAKTLQWAEDLLTPYRFFRSHKSHLINLAYVKSFHHDGDAGYVVMNNETKIPVSRGCKIDFLKLFEGTAK